MKRVLSVALLGALGLAAACDEASAPEGAAGTITASVYVDTDATGSLDPQFDVPLATLDVALVRDGQVVETRDVGANGQVTFTDVAPGSYRLELVGDPPSGAALAGSPRPAAVVPFTGGEVAVDFRFVYFPGSLSGRVYRDENANGAYDAGVDTPGSDLKVTFILPLLGGNLARIDSTRTDDEGRYEFTKKAPGEFLLEFEAAGTMSYGEGGATREVTVLPDQAVTFDVTFTGSASITIAEARALSSGSLASVRGHAVVTPGTFGFTSSAGVAMSEIWLQDATGGIAAVIPTPDPAVTIETGDLIEITGAIALSSGEIRIGSTGSPAAVKKLAGNDPVEPRALTPAQVAAFEHEGELVTVGAMVVVNTSNYSSSTGSFNVNGTLADGSSFTVRVSNGNLGLTQADFPTGKRIFATGPFTRFGTGASPTRQVKVRSAADVVPVQPLATVRAAAANSIVAATGVIVVPPNVFNTSAGTQSELSIQDATGGIILFSVPPSNTTLQLGDSVDVLGVRSDFAGREQIVGNAAQPLVIMERGTSGPVVATPNTGAQVLSLADEGKLVVVADLTVQSVGTANSAGVFEATVRHADGSTFVVRNHHRNTGLVPASLAVGSTYTITGVLTVNVSGGTTTVQLKPRFTSDVVPQ